MATQAPTRPASPGSAAGSPATAAGLTTLSGRAAAPETHPSHERPAPSTATVDLKSDSFSDVFSEIDELERGSKPAAPAKPPEKPAAPAKPATEAKTTPAQKPPEKASEKPVAPAKPEEKPAEAAATTKPEEAGEPAAEADPTAHIHLAPDLRKELRRQFKENSSLKTEVQQLREQVKKPDTQQTTALVEENKRLKDRLNEIDQELRYVEYTKSNEFKERFEKPFQDALADAYEEITEFPVTDSEGNTRAATSKDFNTLLDAPKETVRKLAQDMFGDYAQDALAMRRKLIDLRRSADREAKRYRDEAKTRETERLTKQVEERETVEKLWKRSIEQVVEKFPQYFAPVEGDAELNEALEKGYAVVDKAHDPKLPREERIERMAVARAKAAAFPAMQLRNKRLADRVKELEGYLAEYEKSEPGEGSRPTNGEPHGGEPGMPEGYVSAEDAIDELAQRDTADR